MRYSTNISKALHIEAFIWQTTYESDFLSQITRILDSYFFPVFPSCGVPGLYPWSHSLFCFHQWPFLCSSSQLNCSLCWYNHLYSRHWSLTGFNLHFKSVSTWKTRVSKTLKTKSMITHSNTKVTGSTMELSVEGNQVEHVPSFHFSWLLWGRKVTEYLRKFIRCQHQCCPHYCLGQGTGATLSLESVPVSFAACPLCGLPTYNLCSTAENNGQE